jgi:uncharacterized protein YndB with AHSA1/START domain
MTDSPTTRDLVFTRLFEAPIEQVWKAWTDPASLMGWWGPDHFTCPSAEIDLREGGTSIVCMRAPKEFGGQDIYSTWEYRKIAPMEQIEFIHNLSDREGNKLDPVTLGMPPDFPKDQLQSVSFKEVGNGGTEMTVKEYGWTEGEMIKMSEMGMEQSLDKLAALLRGEKPNGR